jgi:hypothetical protein
MCLEAVEVRSTATPRPARRRLKCGQTPGVFLEPFEAEQLYAIGSLRN